LSFGRTRRCLCAGHMRPDWLRDNQPSPDNNYRLLSHLTNQVWCPQEEKRFSVGRVRNITRQWLRIKAALFRFNVRDLWSILKSPSSWNFLTDFPDQNGTKLPSSSRHTHNPTDVIYGSLCAYHGSQNWETCWGKLINSTNRITLSCSRVNSRRTASYC